MNSKLNILPNEHDFGKDLKQNLHWNILLMRSVLLFEKAEGNKKRAC